MKTRLIAILLMASASGAMAQSYQVYKIRGDVKVQRLQKWTMAIREMPVALTDSLNIATNSSLGLLNSKTNQILTIDKSGKYRVKAAVDATMKNAGNVSALTTQNIAAAIASKGGGNTPQYNVYGATMRTDQATVETNQHLAALLSALVGKVRGGEQLKPSQKLALVRHTDGDICHFSVKNNDSKPYVVNILRIPKEGNPTFCINFDKTDSEYFFALVAPNEELVIDNFQFLVDDATYALIATEDVFDASWIEKALTRKDITAPKKRCTVEISLLGK